MVKLADAFLTACVSLSQAYQADAAQTRPTSNGSAPDAVYEREQLELQCSVLAAQVDAQQEKIRDLEAHVSDRRQKLESSETLLQEVS